MNSVDGEDTSAAVHGLSSTGAEAGLRRFGPNVVPEVHVPAWKALLSKFWAPVPWMLEATIPLELLLGKYTEAIVIAVLLVLNSTLSFVQERRASDALALLRRRLTVQARVLRDGHWRLLRAQDLVPGDIVHLRMGDIAPADIRILDGALLLDQSALTGESLPVDATAGASAYAGAVAKRGEATGVVTATGTRTYFGTTAELVQRAKTVTHIEAIIFTIVKYLVALDAVLVVILLGYALSEGLPLLDTLTFALILLVASIPVALPATFTLATALGAVELARKGVLVTRLSAIEEAAAMNVLCTDKTGTITENRLELAAARPHGTVTEPELLRLAAMACDEATQDPIDLAILTAAQARGASGDLPRRLEFIPFDPATKRSEARYEHSGGQLRVVKGSPQVIFPLTSEAAGAEEMVERLAAEGYRVLAVAAGGDGLELIGLIALEDPPREDSRALVTRLQELGVHVIMVTGDGIATARTIAARVGIGGDVCPREALQSMAVTVPACGVFAGVLPEDKYRLVQTLQRQGDIVGMTGDGVNDAPALKQAEVGVAVANATDVAKAAASVVLTNPGLQDTVAAIESSRRIYQRMLTYTLNKIIKTFEIAIFLSVGVITSGVFVVTPLLIVLLLFTNDFVTMSIATDRAEASAGPERWRIPVLMTTAGVLAALVLTLSFSVFFAGRDWLRLPLPQLQTLIFVMLVFTGQSNIYLVRERGHFWRSRPSNWLLLSSLLDIIVVSTLAISGVLMTAIPSSLVLGLLAAVLGFMVAADFVKVRLFSYFNLR
ncbi:MAG: plasma-membrane proton-efflux P-type ATPase [Chromatiales bacterium 21-64-14]|nr:MAG: plasma-membrane proton-efflux P-type ATPase [Chromatiales bacterium 21-64-14]